MSKNSVEKVKQEQKYKILIRATPHEKMSHQRLNMI